MKNKKVILAVFSFFLSSFIFAETTKNLAISSVDIKGNLAESNSWVSSLREKLITSILNNSNNLIQIVDSAKLDEIIARQKSGETGLYDEKTVSEVGKLASAEFVLFPIVTVSEQGYNVDCRITEVASSKLIASSSELYKNSEDFSTYAANVATAALLPKMGIVLSSYTIAVLNTRKKVSDMSLSEAQAIQKNISDTISNIKKQLESTSLTDILSETKRTQLAAEQAQLEIQQKEATARVERLKQDELRREEERKLAAQRSDAMKKRIEENSLVFDEKANEIKKVLEKELSIDGKLLVVEQKKKALLDLRVSATEKIMEHNKLQDNDCIEEIKLIEAEPYLKTETKANGKPTSEAKKNRKLKIESVKQKYELLKSDYEKDQMAAANVSDSNIIADILTDINKLNEPQRISSLTSGNLLRFGNFDGEKKGWEADFSLMILGNLITTEKFFISYKAITGKSPEFGSTDYEETVEEYDSYFNMNIPVVYAEIEYHIIRHPNDEPSNYRIFIDHFYLYNITTGETIFEKTGGSKKATLVLAPAVDVDLDVGFDPYEIYEKLSKKTDSNVSLFSETTNKIGVNLLLSKYPAVGVQYKLLFSKGSFNFGPGVGMYLQNENFSDLSLGFMADVGGVLDYNFTENLCVSTNLGVQFQTLSTFLTGYGQINVVYKFNLPIEVFLGFRYAFPDQFGVGLGASYFFQK